jgi:hypothetical protein
MTSSRKILFAILVSLLAAPPPGARAAQIQGMAKDPFSAVPAAAFQNSIGICVHLGYDSAHGWGNNAYGDFEGKVMPALRYLAGQKKSLRLLRDSFAYTYYLPKFEQINAELGIRFTLYPGTGPQVDYNAGMAWVKQHPNVVRTAEGNNEFDNWAPIFGGSAGPQAGVAEQKQIYQDLQGTGILVANMSVANPDNWGQVGDLSAVADLTNAHVYPAGGVQPGNWIPAWLQRQATPTPGKPIAITESGYSTLPSTVASVSYPVQAKQILNLFFDAFFYETVIETSIYELLDENPDPGGTDREQHFGIFEYDGKPKPAATAIANLLSIIDDQTGTQGGRLAYTTQGLNGRAVLMRKNNGAFLIVVWAEPEIWDQGTRTEKPAPTQDVTVAFGETAQTVQVFDPMVSADPIAQAQNAGQINVQVVDHPIIIELNGPAGTTTNGLTIPVATIGTPPGGAPAGTGTQAAGTPGTPQVAPATKWDQLAQAAMAKQGTSSAVTGSGTLAVSGMQPTGTSSITPPSGLTAIASNQPATAATPTPSPGNPTQQANLPTSPQGDGGWTFTNSGSPSGSTPVTTPPTALQVGGSPAKGEQSGRTLNVSITADSTSANGGTQTISFNKTFTAGNSGNYVVRPGSVSTTPAPGGTTAPAAVAPATVAPAKAPAPSSAALGTSPVVSQPTTTPLASTSGPAAATAAPGGVRPANIAISMPAAPPQGRSNPVVVAASPTTTAPSQPAAPPVTTGGQAPIGASATPSTGGPTTVKGTPGTAPPVDVTVNTPTSPPQGRSNPVVVAATPSPAVAAQTVQAGTMTPSSTNPPGQSQQSVPTESLYQQLVDWLFPSAPPAVTTPVASTVQASTTTPAPRNGTPTAATTPPGTNNPTAPATLATPAVQAGTTTPAPRNTTPATVAAPAAPIVQAGTTTPGANNPTTTATPAAPAAQAKTATPAAPAVRVNTTTPQPTGQTTAPQGEGGWTFSMVP